MNNESSCKLVRETRLCTHEKKTSKCKFVVWKGKRCQRRAKKWRNNVLKGGKKSRHCWFQIQSPYSDSSHSRRSIRACVCIEMPKRCCAPSLHTESSQNETAPAESWRKVLGASFISHFWARHINWKWIWVGGRLINVDEWEQDGNLLCRLRDFWQL